MGSESLSTRGTAQYPRLRLRAKSYPIVSDKHLYSHKYSGVSQWELIHDYD